MSLYNPIQLNLEFYNMTNGLSLEILNTILRIFHRCWDFVRKWPLQNSRKSVQN